MKSSTGSYFHNIDFLRGIAVLMVMVWHYVHPFVPYSTTTYLLVDFFEEGHMGVALFMVISGFLFASLVLNKAIDPVLFIYNRFLRLAPLLILVLLFWTIYDQKGPGFMALQLLKGFLNGGWPYGSWSIAVEVQFYALFPIILWATKLRIRRLLALLILIITVRLCVYGYRGEVQLYSYWTLGGRADQFLIGLIAGTWFKARPHDFTPLLGITLLNVFFLFAFAVHQFNEHGGFYAMDNYPTNNSLWVYWPTLEAVGFGALLLSTFALALPNNAITKPITWIGECSYSIYLLHFIFFEFLKIQHISPLAQKLSPQHWGIVACGITALYFLVIIGVSRLSFIFIEKTFLGFRRSYLRDQDTG